MAVLGVSIRPVQACQAGRMVWAFQRVLLVRHGETEWNRSRRRQGQLDSALAPQGRQSAADAAQRLNGLGLVDGLFSSPLGRARATAEVMAGAIGLPVLVLDGLAEVHHGDFAGLTNSQIEERYPGALADHPEQKYTLRFPSGESYQDVDRRAETAYRHIEKTGANAPLLVRHEMVGRMLLSRLLGLDPENALKRSLAHRAIYDITPGAKVVANL